MGGLPFRFGLVEHQRESGQQKKCGESGHQHAHRADDPEFHQSLETGQNQRKERQRRSDSGQDDTRAQLDHGCLDGHFPGSMPSTHLFPVARQPVDSIVITQADHQRRKDHGQNIQVTHHQGGQAKSEGERGHRVGDLEQRSPEPFPEHDQEESQAAEGDESGDAHIVKRRRHLVDVHGFTPGDSRLNIGKILAHLGNDCSHCFQGTLGVVEAFPFLHRSDENHQVALIIGPEVAFLFLIPAVVGKKETPRRAVLFALQKDIHALQAVHEEAQIKRLFFVFFLLIIEESGEQLPHHGCRNFVVDQLKKVGQLG